MNHFVILSSTTSGTASINTNASTATITGGIGPFTQLWTQTSGGAGGGGGGASDNGFNSGAGGKGGGGQIRLFWD